MAAKKVTAEEKTTKVNNTATTVETAVKKAAARRKPGRKPAPKAAEAAPKAETKPEVKAETKPETKSAPKETMVLQFGGREIDGSELFARAKEIWTEMGHDAAELSDVKLYVKPDDLAAYYVLNGDTTGCINL